ncbi:hypothetical protein NE237_026233 [Protea cynaroides]|uniref:Uncharacterized protein n=1 Tax=Protea cynaroides TaxID=273540 RepID=A0A9Q0H3D0_9MAGN|nr:hypothetical protein NE237_026233 [Protea cynaroides]
MNQQRNRIGLRGSEAEEKRINDTMSSVKGRQCRRRNPVGCADSSALRANSITEALNLVMFMDHARNVNPRFQKFATLDDLAVHVAHMNFVDPRFQTLSSC